MEKKLNKKEKFFIVLVLGVITIFKKNSCFYRFYHYIYIWLLMSPNNPSPTIQ